jgi:hypothetical protein
VSMARDYVSCSCRSCRCGLSRNSEAVGDLLDAGRVERVGGRRVRSLGERITGACWPSELHAS